jgi:hypothetical protein
MKISCVIQTFLILVDLSDRMFEVPHHVLLITYLSITARLYISSPSPKHIIYSSKYNEVLCKFPLQ